MRTFLRHAEHQRIQHGPFQLMRIRPGLPLHNPADQGLGPLGLIDHATLQPGVLVKMHQHCNDEILSYLRQGTLVHEDSTGQRVALTPTHLMMMNAGQGFSHEESIPADGDPVEMLQIFIRPAAPDLAPQVKFHRFEVADSLNAWRLVGGPVQSGAPLSIRSAVWVYDVQLSGHTLALPPLQGHTALLYVFSGQVQLSDAETSLERGDAVLVDGEELSVTAADVAQLVLFVIDRQAEFSRAGTLSG